MLYSLFKWLVVFQVILASANAQSLTNEVPDLQIIRKALLVENDILDSTIGRFSSGQNAVYIGHVDVTQRQQLETINVNERSLASLIGANGTAELTVKFLESDRWIRLSQKTSDPGKTYATRLRSSGSTPGISASCNSCAQILDQNPEVILLLKFKATGALLDTKRSAFSVDLTGKIQRVNPSKLTIGLLENLNTETPLSRRDPPFQGNGIFATRRITQMIRIPVGSAADAEPQTSCDIEASYTAEHFVNPSDLTQFGVRNVEIQSKRMCCTDNDSHTGIESCLEERVQ